MNQSHKLDFFVLALIISYNFKDISEFSMGSIVIKKHIPIIEKYIELLENQLEICNEHCLRNVAPLTSQADKGGYKQARDDELIQTKEDAKASLKTLEKFFGIGNDN